MISPLRIRQTYTVGFWLLLDVLVFAMLVVAAEDRGGMGYAWMAGILSSVLSAVVLVKGLFRN